MRRLPSHNACLVLAVALGAGIHAYAAAVAEQARKAPKTDQQTQLLNNYRKYPDRYIRISDESWKYDETTQTALHSFTLKNNAGAAYSSIELRASYLDQDGKTLLNQVLPIPGALSPYQVKKFKDLKVKKVPRAATQVLLMVTKGIL
jgi:hypothetical protein